MKKKNVSKCEVTLIEIANMKMRQRRDSEKIETQIPVG